MLMIRICIYLTGITLVLSGVDPLCFAQTASEDDVVATDPQEDMADLVNLATLYIDQQDYAGAVDVYSRLLEEFPGNKQVHYLRGLLNHKLGRIEEAKIDYQFLVDNSAGDTAVFNNLGAIYAADDEFEQAYKWFTRAIREEPGKAEVYDNLAELLMQDKDYDEAAPVYEKLIAIEQDNTRALYNLGVTYTKIGDYAKAQRQWEKALEIDPGDQDTRVVLEQTKKQLEDMTVQGR